MIADEVFVVVFVYFVWKPNHSIALLTVAFVVAVADAEFDSVFATVIVVAVAAIDLVAGVAPAVAVVFLTDLFAFDFQA